MRKKRLAVLCSILLGATLVASLSMVPCAHAKNYKWKVGHILPDSIPCGAAGNEFARLVEERTNGQVKLNNYFAQQLGPWMEQFDMLAKGTLEMGFLSVSPRYKSLYPLSAPWVVTGWDQFRKLYFKGGPLYKYTEKAMDELGVKLLHPFCIGFEGVGGMKGPIIYPEDIKRLKIKVRTMAGLSTLFWEDLGPVVKIDSAEVFTALQLGTVDVQADQCAMLNYGSFKEVTKHYTDLDAFPAFGTLIINKKLWESLPHNLQKVLEETATELCQNCTLASQQQEEQIYTLFEKEGTVITRLTPEQRAKWWEEARKPGGYFDKLRKEIGDEMVDFLLKVAAEAQK